MAQGDFAHFDIPADDVARAQGFYEKVFGWKFNAPPGMDGYFLFSTPGGLGGGLGERGKTAPQKLRVYFLVDSVDIILPIVAAAGGSTVEGRSEVPGFGWFAVIRDTEGSEIGVFEALPR